MQYHWLLFDADNTLFDFDKSMRFSFQAALETTGLPYKSSFLDIYEQINHQCWSDFEHGKLTKEELRSQRFELFFEAIEVQYDAFKFESIYLNLLSQSTFLIDGAQELLEELHGEFRIGLVTNGLREVQRPRLAKSGLQHFFDVVVVSDEIGHAKPHAAFFDYAFTEMQQPEKEQVIMIGDNLNADIKGAADYGLDTCWYNPKQTILADDINPSYVIEHLQELRAILK